MSSNVLANLKMVNGDLIRSTITFDDIVYYINKIYEEYTGKYENVSLIMATDLYCKIIQDAPTFEVINEKSKMLLESVDELFSNEFWGNEHIKSISSNLLAPVSIRYSNNQIDDITMNLDTGKRLYSIPIALYDESQKKFMFLNNNLKKRILERFFSNTQIYNSDGFENVDNVTANQIGILMRATFYDSRFEISKSNGTNNLIRFKIQREDQSYFALYTLVDYGIPDPEYTENFSSKMGILRITPTIIDKMDNE
jgi:hypothetical protein